MESTDNSIVVTRVAMEDNIFDASVRNERSRLRSATDNSSWTYRPIKPQSMTFLQKYGTPYCLLSISIQAIFALFANSLSMLADAARLFSDLLEMHQYDRVGTPAARITEIISMGVGSVVMLILSVVFLVTASTRATRLDFEVNVMFLIFATAASVTTNTIQVLIHIREWKSGQSRNLVEYLRTHRKQIFHGIGNHGVGILPLVSSAMLIASDSYLISDSIATYVSTIIIVANAVAAGTTCYNEYCSLDYNKADYESI